MSPISGAQPVAEDRFEPSSPEIPFARRVGELKRPPSPSLSRGEQPQAYQQTAPGWIDPAGDAALIRMLDKAPEDVVGGVWRYLFKGEKWHDHGGQATPDHISADKPRFRVKQLSEEWEAVLHKFSDIKPHIGPEHEWSDQAQDYFGLGFWRRLGSALRGQQDLPTPTLGSKLILMLAMGQTSRFAVTGREEVLTSRLMQYENGSVGLSDMFAESYRLHKGDLYQTLLCAENVLAYDVNDPDREHQPLQAKLEYIRDDQPQVGDNFGAWYHFFGTALYGLMRDGWKAKGVGAIESMGSRLMEGRDPQEAYVNLAGAELGQRLKRLVSCEKSHKTL